LVLINIKELLISQYLKIVFMKRELLALTIATGIALSASAQVPEKKSRSLVLKFTETWCGPCGDWGWSLAESIIGDIGDKGYYVGVMGSSSPATMNANCYGAFESNYPVTGYPTFIVNDEDGGYYLSTVQSKYNTFAGTVPLASPAGIASISGNTISVSTKTKFWSAASGEFYLAAFVVEDKVMAEQNGQSGVVEHHHLMRGSMMPDNSPWGQSLANGTVAVNTEISKSFSMTIPSHWNKSNLSVMLAVYKKESGKYKFINAMKATSGTTSVAAIAGMSEVTLYPNPSRDGKATLRVTLEASASLRVAVTDLTGRKVYAADARTYQQGVNEIAIPAATLPNGMYTVSLYSDKGVKNQPLVIAR